MKERYDKVRSGGASDALELPQGQSLENQDAQNQPVPEGSDEPVRERSTLVLDPSSGKLVPIPSGGKYYDAGGTLGRRYTGGRGTCGSTCPRIKRIKRFRTPRVKRQWSNSNVRSMLKPKTGNCQAEAQAVPNQPL